MARVNVRTAFMLPAAIALFAGLDAALNLLGVWAPLRSGRLADSHGVLMVFGFLGTVICLERAVAWRRPAGYLVPAGFGVGALLLLAGMAGPPALTDAAGFLTVAAAAGLCALYVPLWRRQRDDAVLVSALGAALALGGALLWRAGAEMVLVTAWLVGFLVLTIAGERLELARLAMPPRAARHLVQSALGLCVAVAAATLWPVVGGPLLGLALAAVAGWLVAYDVARRTVRGTGLPRFIAVCMLSAQCWLAVAAAIWCLGVGGAGVGGAGVGGAGVGGAGGDVAGAARAGNPAYDAAVHAVALGFAVSMIFAHAPTILPAITGIALPYRAVLYVPWALLQTSLLVRLWLGDAFGLQWARQIGGAGNVLSLLLFIVVVVSIAGGAGHRAGRAGRPAGRAPVGAR